MIRAVFLADFGIARPLDDISGITTTNMTVGTVAYAAPEQLMGEEMDGRADQYALAATAYHLLTGSQLFPHSNPAVVISRHLNAPVPALADARPDLASLDPVLAAALAKNPDDRFACCTDFARAFTETAAPQTPRVAAAPTTPAPAARRPHVTPLRPKPMVLPPRATLLAPSRGADRHLGCSGIAAARCYRGAVAAMAAPAVQYHRHLIEQCTDHIHPDPDRDGSRTVPCPDFCCAGASPDEYGSGSHGDGHDEGPPVQDRSVLREVRCVHRGLAVRRSRHRADHLLR